MLLRLRKQTKTANYDHDERYKSAVAPPEFVPPSVTIAHLQTDFEPIIPEKNRLWTAFVHVDVALTAKLNEALSASTRSSKRIGWFMSPCLDAGLLVQDMSPKGNVHECTFEFKLKWLDQSPNAPLDARRCRTCALQAMKQLPIHDRFCPLAFTSGNHLQIKSQVQAMVHKQRQSIPLTSTLDDVSDALAAYFCGDDGQTLVKQLKFAQVDNDSLGVLKLLDINPSLREIDSETLKERVRNYLVAENARTPSQNATSLSRLGCAMTFRDCTIFLRVRFPNSVTNVPTKTKQTEIINVKVGDLDYKFVHPTKLAKWALDELDLWSGGYYLGEDDNVKSNASAGIGGCMIQTRC